MVKLFKMQKSIGENVWIFAVAALAAAWIEMLTTGKNGVLMVVAALAAAWIEITSRHLSTIRDKSRPLRPRGLKF